MMKFNIITTTEAWDNLAADWNALLESSASHVPFLRHEYQQAWWQTRGGGEWNPEGSHLKIVTAEEDGELIGIAPLFSTLDQQNQPVLMFIGSIEVSDYLDFITSPQNLPRFIPALLEFLNKQADPACHRLDLYNILQDSPSLSALEASAQSMGWKFTREKLQPAPFITLPGDWETYLSGIDKKQRHEIRRKLRRLEEASLTSDLYICDDPQVLSTETLAFIEMMAGDPAKQAFLTQAMRQHLNNTAKVAFDHNWLQLAYFTIGGDKAAAYMNFIYNRRIWVYNSAYNAEYSLYSPGWVLLALLIQWAIENGLQELDFMRGDESYKYKFGGVDRFVMHAILSAK